MVMTMERDDVSSRSTLDMTCQELGCIISQDKTPNGWREFQQELKKSNVLTSVGIQQILAGALQSRVDEIDRRDADAVNDMEMSFSELSDFTKDESCQGPSSWGDSFLSFAPSSTANKRGTMNMIFSGLVGEVDDNAATSLSKTISRRATGLTTSTASSLSSRRGSVASTSIASFRRGSVATTASSRRGSVASSSTSGRTSLASTRQASFRSGVSSRGAGLTQSQKAHRRGSSMFADVMSGLNGEQKFSVGQAMAHGSYVSRRGSTFASTTDYSDVIQSKEDDSEKIQSFKRVGNGAYTAASFMATRQQEKPESSTQSSSAARSA